MGSKKLLTAVVALVAVMVLVAPAMAQVAPTGSWSAKTPSGVGTMGSEGSGTSDGTYMWYVGGNGSPQMNQRYDPATNTIWNGAPYTLGYPYYHATGNIGGPGGSNYVNAAYSAGFIFRYNIATNQWTQSVASNQTSWRSAACSGNGLIWFSGGGQSSSAMMEFDGTTLTTRAPMPATMTGHSMAYIPTTGLIYAVGGTFGGSICYEFNPGTNSWSTRAARPTTTAWGTSIFSLKSRIYSLTGSDASVYEFAPTANIWTRRADCPTTAHQQMSAGGTLGVQKGFVWGGASTNAISEFIPPSFGADPTEPPLATVKQIGSLGDTAQAGTNPALGWTNAQIMFEASVTDPDLPAQQVALEVEVRSSLAGWGTIPILNSGMKPQGTIQLPFNIPAGGDYDWRYRVRDAFDNYTPNTGGIPGWFEFKKNTVTADFRSDQVPPTTNAAISPAIYDVQVPSQTHGNVDFTWTATTDNGPMSAITYEVQISLNDPAFSSPVVDATGLTSLNATYDLLVSRYNYYWHVRAQDIGGNHSAWSPTQFFRVAPDANLPHANTATKFCGMSAPFVGGPSTGLLLGAVLTVLAGLRRRK